MSREYLDFPIIKLMIIMTVMLKVMATMMMVMTVMMLVMVMRELVMLGTIIAVTTY